ncbi:MAG TPA: glycine zipper 2TM domain-containing protein [Allosphingosinicella sp.]|nr:glycine zipper 2TM domain-containing protein [Allosphingosinicella sp.]
MRILLVTAAAVFAIAGGAAPAFAQFGGSPQEQVDGAPADPGMTAPPGDEEDMESEVAYPSEDHGDAVDMDVDADFAADAGGAGKPGFAADGEEYAAYDGSPGDVGQAGADDYDGVDAGEEEGPPEVDEGGTWQGEDGQVYCRRSDGTTGAIVGGGAGALVGNGIDGGRRRGAGTIIGGIIGALIGSAVERSSSEQSCR